VNHGPLSPDTWTWSRQWTSTASHEWIEAELCSHPGVHDCRRLVPQQEPAVHGLIYEYLPNWLFGTLTVAVFVMIGLAGLYLTHAWARRLHIVDHSHNDIVGFYLAAVTVFMGSHWRCCQLEPGPPFPRSRGKFDHEATSLGSLYRDVNAHPEPLRNILRDDLRRYTRQAIDDKKDCPWRRMRHTTH